MALGPFRQAGRPGICLCPAERSRAAPKRLGRKEAKEEEEEDRSGRGEIQRTRQPKTPAAGFREPVIWFLSSSTVGGLSPE